MRVAITLGLVLVSLCLGLVILAAIGIGFGYLIHAGVPAVDLGSSVVAGFLTMLVASMLFAPVLHVFLSYATRVPSPSAESANEDGEQDVDEESAQEEAELAADRIAEALFDRLETRLSPKPSRRSRYRG